jgi:hypothetical protein
MARRNRRGDGRECRRRNAVFMLIRYATLERVRPDVDYNLAGCLEGEADG